MTANWMSGYVADVNYTLGFYRELAPSFLSFACLVNGVDAASPLSSKRYCELGCGRGYGTILLAAANPNFEFVGVDFNPSHIAEARALATRAKIANITFVESSFADAALSPDEELCDFDIIVLHGVYTWVERSVRANIVQFMRDKLLAGGLVYNSYNCLPGWSVAMPVQRIMIETLKRSSRDSFAVLAEAHNTLKILSEKSSAFVTQNQSVRSLVERMAHQDKSYLAHEFLNTGWEPLYVTDVMSDLTEAKLTYVGSATLIENQFELSVPNDLVPLVSSAADAGMRELLKDFILNKQFRRDIYVKGPRPLSYNLQRECFAKHRFAAIQNLAQLPKQIPIPIGIFEPNRAGVDALAACLKDNTATGLQLIDACGKAGLREADAIVLIVLLVNHGALAPALPQSSESNGATAQRLNQLIFEITATTDSHHFLASPSLGSAIATNFVERLVAPLVLAERSKSDIEIASIAFDRLARTGQSFNRDGKALSKTDENLHVIAEMIGQIRKSVLPRWRGLGLIPNHL